jgi:hypothetical protein
VKSKEEAIQENWGQKRFPLFLTANREHDPSLQILLVDDFFTHF